MQLPPKFSPFVYLLRYHYVTAAFCDWGGGIDRTSVSKTIVRKVPTASLFSCAFASVPVLSARDGEDGLGDLAA